jgi:hypothetical protein
VTRCFNRAFSLGSAITLLTASPPSLAAQSPGLLNGPAVGGSLDRFIYEGEGVTAFTFRYSDLRSRTVGSEIGVSLFPDAPGDGALYLAPDLGAAFNASGPGVTVLAKVGISTLTALGGGFAFIPGYHWGAGLIVRIGARSGIRLDAVRHFYLAGDGTEGIWSLGLGFTSLPRKPARYP